MPSNPYHTLAIKRFSATLLFFFASCLVNLSSADEQSSQSDLLESDAFKKGTIAYYMHDYKTAQKYWRPLAKQGNSVTQVLVGSLYAFGQGVKRNDAEAVRWYSLAADQGSAQGQYNLGIMYENGFGVDKDKIKAVELYKLAANQGRKDAKEKLKALRSSLASSSTGSDNLQTINPDDQIALADEKSGNTNGSGDHPELVDEDITIDPETQHKPETRETEDKIDPRETQVAYAKPTHKIIESVPERIHTDAAGVEDEQSSPGLIDYFDTLIFGPKTQAIEEYDPAAYDEMDVYPGDTQAEDDDHFNLVGFFSEMFPELSQTTYDFLGAVPDEPIIIKKDPVVTENDETDLPVPDTSVITVPVDDAIQTLPEEPATSHVTEIEDEQTILPPEQDELITGRNTDDLPEPVKDDTQLSLPDDPATQNNNGEPASLPIQIDSPDPTQQDGRITITIYPRKTKDTSTDQQ